MSTTRRWAEPITLSLSPELKGSDLAIAELYEQWRQLEQAFLDSIVELGKAEKAAYKRGDKKCARVAKISRAQSRIGAEQRKLYRRMAMTPAQGMLGIAFKLIQWRYDAALSAHKGLEQPYEACAFSAYQDALRILGLEALAHPSDDSTLNFITSPRGLTSKNWLPMAWEPDPK